MAFVLLPTYPPYQVNDCVPGVVEAALQCLWSLAAAPANCPGLLRVEHLVVTALRDHSRTPRVALAGLGCLQNLACCEGNRAALMHCVPAVLEVMGQHRGVQAVVQSGLACIRNLATHNGNKVRVYVYVCAYVGGAVPD